MPTKNRERLFLILALTSVALLVGDQLLLTPLSRLWKKRSERIAELEQSVRRGTALIERERSIRKRWRQIQAGALPEKRSVAENQVLKSVNRWAQTSGISFTSIKPQWHEYNEGYQTLECRATAFGDLQEVSRFLYELEQDPAAVRIENFEIKARDNRGSKLDLALQMSGLLLPGEKP